VLQVAVNRLLKGVKTRQVTSIFAGQNSMTASLLGSPMAESPMVTPALTLEEWKAMHHGLIVAKNVRKPKTIPQTQMGLPF
jgi:hypothetical protein